MLSKSKEVRICCYCGCDVIRYKCNHTKRTFCCVEHKKLFQTNKTLEELHGKEKALELKSIMSENSYGSNNPNYGNKWSDERKQKHSEFIKEVFKNDKIRYKCGNANRGVTFSQERIHKMHGGRSKESYSRPMSDETKEKVGLASRLKFTDEYKEKQRKTMEDLGYWTPLDEKDPYSIYFNISDWIHQMYPLIEVNNTIPSKDRVRDHIIPRWVAYALKIFPEITRHPLNCQILSRGDNTRKGISDRKVPIIDWEIRLIELIESILCYDKEWCEQENAINSCHAYLNGQRWSNIVRKEASDE